jgi:hypothetical protein
LRIVNRSVICATALPLVVIGSVTAAAQQQQQPPAEIPPAAVNVPAPPRAVSFFATATSAADSNIDHNDENLRAYGVAVGGGAEYQNRPDDPSVLITYRTALHRYARTDRWNRLSHNLRAAFERELDGPWEVHAIGEISLKGTSEDRELSNQYIVTPRLQYRIDRWRRVRTYATLRLRRYDEDAGRNATNRYAGVEFTQRSEHGDEWDVELRLEKNGARDPRQTYNRWTFGTQYLTPLSERNRLEFDVRFRQQKYTNRLVEVDDTDVPRRDIRWIPSAYWVRTINAHMDLRLGYSFEARASNDLGRDFSAHEAIMTATRRW